MFFAVPDMDVHGLDLNLLTVFVQIHKDRQVSLAAEHLGLSQPAVSGALKRLRLLLEDEVFIRTSRGMQPTPLADRLLVPIANALSMIHDSLSQQLDFDATSSSRHFVFAMTDIGEISFLPSMINKLRVEAPNLDFSTVRNYSVNLKSEMESGKVDFAIGHFPELQSDFYRRLLFTSGYVCLFRRGHPFEKAINPVEAFMSAEHVRAVSTEIGHGRVDEAMERQGFHRRIRLSVPHIVALADVLESSDLLATVPETFARRSAQHFNLAYLPHPIELPRVEVGLFWHAKYHRDPGNQWMRGIVAELFQAESPPGTQTSI